MKDQSRGLASRMELLPCLQCKKRFLPCYEIGAATCKQFKPSPFPARGVGIVCYLSRSRFADSARRFKESTVFELSATDAIIRRSRLHSQLVCRPRTSPNRVYMGRSVMTDNLASLAKHAATRTPNHQVDNNLKTKVM